MSKKSSSKYRYKFAYLTSGCLSDDNIIDNIKSFLKENADKDGLFESNLLLTEGMKLYFGKKADIDLFSSIKICSVIYWVDEDVYLCTINYRDVVNRYNKIVYFF